MLKCPKCGTEMEAKGELANLSTFLQCPKCKNIELAVKHFNNWFSFDYP